MGDEDDEEARDDDLNDEEEEKDADGCKNDDGTAIVASLLLSPRRC